MDTEAGVLPLAAPAQDAGDEMILSDVTLADNQVTAARSPRPSDQTAEPYQPEKWPSVQTVDSGVSRVSSKLWVAPLWVQINIVIRHPSGNEVRLPVSRGKPLHTVMSIACEKLGVQDPSKACFTFHGKMLQPTDTPEGLAMGEGVVVMLGFGTESRSASKRSAQTATFVEPPALDLGWRCDACGAVSATSTAKIEGSPELQCFRCGLRCCPQDVWSRVATPSKKKKDPMSITNEDALQADFEGQRVEAPVGGMLAIVTQEQRERLLKAAVIYLVFCVHFLTISSMQRPVQTMFEMRSVLQQELVDQVIPGTPGLTFLNVSSWEGFWQWTDGVLAGKVYEESYLPASSGAATHSPHSMFTVAKYNRIISAIRFRQVRVRPTLPRCTRNALGLLPTEFDMACARDDVDVKHSCGTPEESHSLSRPCWGAWDADHQESVYPGPVEKASSKIAMGRPQWHLVCPETCTAYYIQGFRTADQNPALGIAGVAEFMLSFDRYVSSATAWADCQAACDVSGSSFLNNLSSLKGKGGSPDFCGSGSKGCSGDVVDLPLNTSQALHLIAAMKRERWTSESTRSVAVDLNVYNPNYDVASVLRLTVDANPGGLLEPHFSVMSCRLTLSGTTVDTLRFVLEILFAFWLVYYFLIEVSEINYQKWMYFADMWNYVELANLGSYAYALISWWTYASGHSFESFRKQDLNNFKDLHAATSEFTHGAVVAALCTAFMCIRFFKYIKLSTRCRLFWSTLGKAKEIIFPLLVVYMGFILAFTFAGHWLFGQRVQIFSSISSAMLYLLLSVKDGVDYTEIKVASPAGAPLWYLCWYLVSKVMVVGLIVAVTIVVFGEMLQQFQAQEKARTKAQEQGAKITSLREYFVQDFCPLALRRSKDKAKDKEANENHRELKETLQEVDLEQLWQRGMQGLLDDELALDAAELAFLFENAASLGGETADKCARHFINRLCSLASLSRIEEPMSISVLDEVVDLESKLEKIATHIHASRTGLERQFHKLRPFLASAQTQSIKLQNTVTSFTSKREPRIIRYVFKDCMSINDVSYLVEMSIVGKDLHISAYDADAERTLELTVKDKGYQRLLFYSAGDHSNIAKRLQLDPIFPVRLEIGPPPNDQDPSPRQIVQRARPGNAVFPGGDAGSKPPHRGQLAMAAAVLDAQRKGDPGVNQVEGRPVIDSFLKAKVLQRETE